MTFVDLTKAFDTMNCELFWKNFSEVGLPDKIVIVIVYFHRGTMMSKSQCSEVFSVSNGTKQYFSFYATFFSMAFQQV